MEKDGREQIEEVRSATQEGYQEEPRPVELSAPKPKGTRFSFGALCVLGFLALCVFGFTLFAAFAPKMPVQGGEIPKTAVQTSTVQDVPDPLIKMAPTYGDLKKLQYTKVAAPGSSGPAGAGQALMPGQPGAQIPAQSPGLTSPAPLAAGTTDSAEQKKEEIQRNAAASPLAFNNGTEAATRQEQPSGGNGFAPLPAVPGPERLAGNGSGSVYGIVDDQNLQGEKRSFSGERNSDFPYLKTQLLQPISEYEIKAGSILPALLITGINSDLPGQIVAQIKENVYDTVTGNYLLLPQGTRVIGEYDSKVAFGQDRVLIVWTRLIMPNGTSISLEGMPGTDLSGYAGMAGNVNNHYGKLILGVVLGSVIGAGAQVATGGQGAPNVPPSFGQLAVSGAAQNINQAGQAHTNKVLNMQPTIEVAPGDKLNIFVTKDMILKPYSD